MRENQSFDPMTDPIASHVPPELASLIARPDGPARAARPIARAILASRRLIVILCEPPAAAGTDASHEPGAAHGQADGVGLDDDHAGDGPAEEVRTAVDLREGEVAGWILAGLTDPSVRAVHVRKPSAGPLSLTQLISQLARHAEAPRPGEPDDELERAGAALRARQGIETRVLLVVEGAEALAAPALRYLQKVSEAAPGGSPTLQLLFVADPEFGALLDREEWQPFREQMAFLALPDGGIEDFAEVIAPDAAEADDTAVLAPPEPSPAAGYARAPVPPGEPAIPRTASGSRRAWLGAGAALAGLVVVLIAGAVAYETHLPTLWQSWRQKQAQPQQAEQGQAPAPQAQASPARAVPAAPQSPTLQAQRGAAQPGAAQPGSGQPRQDQAAASPSPADQPAATPPRREAAALPSSGPAESRPSGTAVAQAPQPLQAPQAASQSPATTGTPPAAPANPGGVAAPTPSARPAAEASPAQAPTTAAPPPSAAATATPAAPAAAAPPAAPPAAQALAGAAPGRTQVEADFQSFLASRARSSNLTDAQRQQLFREFLSWRNGGAEPQVPVPAVSAAAGNAAAGVPVGTVLIAYRGGATARARADAVAASLRGKVRAVRSRPVSAVTRQPTVQYYHPGDEAAAKAVAALLGGEDAGWTVQQSRRRGRRPPTGTVEVVLPSTP